MSRRHTTKAEDRAYLAKRLGDLRTEWKPGDRCLALRGTEATTVAKVEGQIITLANGDSMHFSHMRRSES